MSEVITFLSFIMFVLGVWSQIAFDWVGKLFKWLGLEDKEDEMDAQEMFN